MVCTTDTQCSFKLYKNISNVNIILDIKDEPHIHARTHTHTQANTHMHTT